MVPVAGTWPEDQVTGFCRKKDVLVGARFVAQKD